MMKDRSERVRLSALWAAYGDALGFMSELTDQSGLIHRTGEERVRKTVSWKRKIGGRFGPTVAMPAGAYSDDTQLRLAVTRSIRGDGKFDVEAFANIELPVWLSYALGAGRGTRAAASSLIRDNVNWVTNFYEVDEQSYVSSGGNGAAMRIQPHVWSALNRQRPETYLQDVIRNTIVTHGHPRAILGAVFHALSVADAIENSVPAGPDTWHKFVDSFRTLPEIIDTDRELRDLWLPLWEARTSRRITLAFEEVAAECRHDIEAAYDLPVGDEQAYREYVTARGGTSPESRGSGTKTAIFASVVAWQFRDDVEACLLASANLLRSDTDSISTMAGAVVGASARTEPPGALQDKEYIASQAVRLARISNRVKEATFRYPDLLTWRAPKTQLDAVGRRGGRIFVSGLDFAEPTEPEYLGKGKPITVWQWYRLSFGQTVLAKRREELSELTDADVLPEANQSAAAHRVPEQTSLFQPGTSPKRLYSMNSSAHEKTTEPDLHQLTREAIDADFDPLLIGQHLLSLSEEKDGIERCVAYAAIIAKARRSRLDVGRRSRR